MNAYEQLQAIRERLVEMRAKPDTLAIVDSFIKRAQPDQGSVQSISMLMMARHLARAKDVLNCEPAHLDILGLVGDLEDSRPTEDSSPNAYEVDRRPKPHSFYRQQQQKNK